MIDFEKSTKTLKDFLSADGNYLEGLDETDLVYVLTVNMLKIPLDSIITSNEGCYEGISPESRKVVGKGYEFFLNIDDFSLAIYQDGWPLAGMYMSTRGALYQAGAYIQQKEGEHHFYYAHNLAGINGRSNNIGVWEEVCSKHLDAGIAFEFLTGEQSEYESPFKGQNLTEVFKEIVENFVANNTEAQLQQAEQIAMQPRKSKNQLS